LNNIIPPWITGYIYSALVESYCAEHSARMQAMDAANKNGTELLSELSIQFNRERQARITQEITEVAAGAKARKLQQSRKES
jgi:F-type H+-transporting ATPase subunit gamma